MNTDPLRPHSHDNNETPPSAEPTLSLHLPDGSTHTVPYDALAQFPRTAFSYTFTTDHGKHGPWQLEGVTLHDLITHYWQEAYREVEAISADGFGNRIDVGEVISAEVDPILLCDTRDGQPLLRTDGLVRLVVPSETDNALRQVKWLRTLRVLA